MNQDIYVVIEHVRGQVADISYVMLAAARQLARGTGGDVVAVLLGHQAQGLAANLAARRVLYIDHPALADFTSDAYREALAGLIGENKPRAVLLGNTSMGADVASLLSAHLELPLVSSCHSVDAEGRLTSQICGGKIMAESQLADTTTLGNNDPRWLQARRWTKRTAARGHGGASPRAGEPEGYADEVHRARSRGCGHFQRADLGRRRARHSDPRQHGAGRGIGRGAGRRGVRLAPGGGPGLAAHLAPGRANRARRSSPSYTWRSASAARPSTRRALPDSELIVAVNTDPAAPIFDDSQIWNDGRFTRLGAQP